MVATRRVAMLVSYLLKKTHRAASPKDEGRGVVALMRSKFIGYTFD